MERPLRSDVNDRAGVCEPTVVDCAEMRLVILALVLCRSIVWAQGAAVLDTRRQHTMQLLSDGILLVRASSLLESEKAIGFSQSPYFYYFTGLENGASAILALDGQTKESWLFVPDQMSGFLGRLAPARLPPSSELAQRTGIRNIVPWTELARYLDQRLAGPEAPVLYTAETAAWTATSLPPNLTSNSQPGLYWSYVLAERWPKAKIVPANRRVDAVLLLKDKEEVEHLRVAGRASATALATTIGAIKPAKSQRQVESVAVLACFDAGADSPAFWPWAMAGENAVFPRPFHALGDYRHFNKSLARGELVRVDLGCEVAHYGGDVGRTVPVSGRFDDGQREAWNLYVAAYGAGLNVIRDGAKVGEVREAWKQAVVQRQPRLRTALGKASARAFLNPEATSFWSIHTVGLAHVPTSAVADTLRAGMVIAYEPMASVQGQGFYLEDMLLVTQAGYENLTPGLPYTAEQVEQAMRKRGWKRE